METSITSTTTTSSGGATFNSNQFFKRLRLLYDSWENAENEPLWKSADAVVLALGLVDDNNPYQKTTTLQTWLCGYELKETVIVFLKKSIHIISSPRKIQLFESTSKPADVNLNVQFHYHQINNEDNNKQNFESVFEEVKKSKSGKNIGVIIKEKFIGDFGKAWNESVDQSGLTKVDITMGLASLLSIKDSQELKHMATSAKISDKILKSHLLPKIESIIDKEEKMSHNKLTDFTLDIFSHPEKINAKLTTDTVDYAYTPFIQSGGKYELKLSASSNDDDLHFGTMIVSLGSRFKGYCSNIARTYFVDPTKEQKQNYILLLNAQSILIKNLKPNVKLSTVYDSVVKFIEEQKPGMSKHFLKNCGYGIGLEFQELYSVISSTNHRLIKPGMTFNIMVGFQGLENADAKDEKCKQYSMMIADTVAIEEDGKVNVYTQESQKRPGEVFYTMNDEAEDDEEKEDLLEMTDELKAVAGKTRQTKQKSRTIEEKRRDHQNMLAQKNLEETENKIRMMENKNGETSSQKATAELDYSNYNENLRLYNSVGNYPSDVVKNKITIDSNREAVLLPIYGYIVPFHISTIKNASKTDDYLRINFNVPNTLTQEQIDSIDIPQQLFYIRELTFRIQDPKSLTNTVRLIKELRKRVTTRETENREKSSLIAQEKLILTRGRFPKLNDVSIRPTIAGRRTLGNLEAHENGFRFNPTGIKDKSPIDVLYKNIKHALFQQAEQESIVLIHLNLHDALLIGKKRAKDIQFYTEISEMSQSLDVGSRNFRDEEMEEQREHQIKNKLNAEFSQFVKRVEELVPGGMEFDIPYRDLAFYGVPNVTTTLLQPTVHCLVSIHEVPFFVLTLDEVEIACFERVSRALNNFDLVFVYKDYNKAPTRISIIPRQYFETIKEWLDQINIKFYLSERNLVWKKIMESIKQDLKQFKEDGGWSFLDPEGDEEEDEDDGDEDYEPSESEIESDSLSTQSSMSSDESEDSDESEGEDWDTLNSKAAAEDKKKNFDNGGNNEKDQHKRKRSHKD